MAFHRYQRTANAAMLTNLNVYGTHLPDDTDLLLASVVIPSTP